MTQPTVNLYDKLISAGVCPFAAVNYISKLARKLSKTLGRHEIDSKILKWAYTGQRPKEQVIKSGYAVKLPAEDILSLVEDDEIRNSVFDSLVLSISNYLSHNTLYNNEDPIQYSEKFISMFLLNNDLDLSWVQFQYNGIGSEPKKSRVRILTRIIWDKYEY